MTLLSLLRQTFFTPSISTNDIPDLTGTTAIVTGGTSGLGFITAKELCRKNATVFITARSYEKASKACADIKIAVGRQPRVLIADFEDLDSIKRAAQEFKSFKLPLNILVNNAGVFAVPFSKSKQGIESHYAINNFAHALLTTTLLPSFASNSRIINLTSFQHTRTKTINYDATSSASYKGEQRYYESKLLNLHFSRVLQHKLDASSTYSSKNIVCTSVHPGLVSTNMLSNLERPLGRWETWLLHKFQMSVENGALTQIWAATSPEAGSKGAYFVPFGEKVDPSAQACDQNMAQQSWTWMEETMQKCYDKKWTWKASGL